MRRLRGSIMLERQVYMKIIAINASPRKGGNTATLLTKALEGAASLGAQTELVHLSDLNVKGCYSCFMCKRKTGECFGKCAVKDDVGALLGKITACDGFLIGSPVYFGNITGMLRSFLERLWFMCDATYDGGTTYLKRRIPSALVFTMNVSDEGVSEGKKAYFRSLEEVFSGVKNTMEFLIGSSEILLGKNTYQFSDYSKYAVSALDEPGKRKQRDEVFPLTCREAFAMGEHLVKRAEQGE